MRMIYFLVPYRVSLLDVINCTSYCRVSTFIIRISVTLYTKYTKTLIAQNTHTIHTNAFALCYDFVFSFTILTIFCDYLTSIC